MSKVLAFNLIYTHPWTTNLTDRHAFCTWTSANASALPSKLGEESIRADRSIQTSFKVSLTLISLVL
jgi:hypothetical protein